jgi:lipoprotein-releasing system permease protein
MPYELLLAWRYFYARRRRPLARATAVSAVLSLALGVAALLVALALGRGWRDEIRDKLLGGTAHVVAARQDGGPLTDWRVYANRIGATAGVARVSGTTYEGALITGPQGVAYCQLRGVANGDEREVRRVLVAGSFAPQDAPGQIIIGEELAARLGLRVGELAEIVTGAEALAGGAAHTQKLRVAGIFRTGWREADAVWVFLPLATAARSAGANAEAATAFDVQLHDPDAAGAVSARLRALLGDGFTVRDWQETNRPLFAALALERRAALFVVGVMGLLAALNVLGALISVVAERRADVAVLCALGARARSVVLIFLCEGALIGLLGAICGVALGLAVCWLGNRYGWVSLPAEVYLLNAVRFRPTVADVLQTTGAALALSLLATIYPAWAAARLPPAAGLRD